MGEPVPAVMLAGGFLSPGPENVPQTAPLLGNGGSPPAPRRWTTCREAGRPWGSGTGPRAGPGSLSGTAHQPSGP